jgi:formylglycine-generating enzyme required for sulfatase activity
VGAAERGWRWCRRNPGLAGLAAAVVLSLLGGAAISTYFAVEASANARRATEKAQLADDSARQAEDNARRADDNARRAQAAAVFAARQRDLALESFNTLLNEVQQKLRDTPAMRQLKDSLLQTAERGLAKLSESAGEAVAPEMGLAEARNRLGDSFTQLGKIAAARRAYEAALAVLKAIADAHPEDDRVRPVLAQTCEKLANLSLGEDYPAAGKYAREALQVSEALLQANPRDAAAQQVIASSCYTLAQVERQQGHLAEARSWCRRMLEVNQQRAIREKDQAEAQMAVASAYAALGEVDRQAGELKAAQEAFTRAVAIGRRLAKDGLNTSVRMLQSAHLMSLAETAGQLGDRAGALAGFRGARAVQRALLEAQPHNAPLRAMTALCCGQLSRLTLEGGEKGLAREYAVQWLTAAETLYHGEPGNASWQRLLHGAQEQLGEISLAWDGLIAARNHYRQVLALAQSIAAVAPADTANQQSLLTAHARIADVSQKLGHRSAARRHALAALEVMNKLPAGSSADRARARADLEKLLPQSEKPDDRFVANSIGIDLVLIQPGTFLMGGEEGAKAVAEFFNRKLESETPGLFAGEHPRHEVAITRRFYLGATEVTRGQFREFVKATGYRTDAERDRKGFGDFNPSVSGRRANLHSDWRLEGYADVTDDHPVVGVSWNDAVAFCRWLSHKEGVTYRLPTEAEWEYACRAGTTTRFWTGDDPATLLRGANVPDATFKAAFGGNMSYESLEGRDGFAGSAPVGSFAANPWGLFDMHGNVWEWCLDGYDPKFYEGKVRDDPIGPPDRPTRALRGGCFM